MFESSKTLGVKRFVILILVFLIVMDIAILLNIPFLRQILGFLLLTILPGLLILQILKLNKLESTEKFVLAVGLSISFLMFFGLLVNNLSLYFGYETPLSTVSLLISFNIAFIVFAIIGYKINKEPIFTLPNFNLSTSEKSFLIVPILFPVLSIFGMHVMNTTDNNIILMFLLILIPAYVVYVCFFNHKFSKRLYPVVIFLISISLLLIYMLRFTHIYGVDVHTEYGIYFQTTFDNLHWSAFGHSILDACLSISLLPAIFQSILNVNAQEYLFKGVYVSICSFCPLAIYVLSKKYVGDMYAFLASFFFISQETFLTTVVNPRTVIGIFFAALAITVLFNVRIDPMKKRILFIVFILSVVVSHYSTAYIFFFVLLFSWFAVEIFSKRYAFKKNITLTVALLFFAFIFFWYSQVTETAFNAGVKFVENTFLDLNKFFIAESREGVFMQLAGQELTYPLLSRVNLAVTWGTFILIGIGVLTMIKRFKVMVSISNIEHKKPDFLNTKFEMEYLTMVLACAGLLIIMVALPHVSQGYSIYRLYLLMITILSVFFVIGGITLSKQTFKKSLIKNFSLKKKPLPKKQKEGGGENAEVRAYLIILLILIPSFLFVTGVIYQIFGAHDSIILNSEGEQYDPYYVHDQESYAAKWLKVHSQDKTRVYTDFYGRFGLVSQAGFSPNSINWYSIVHHKKIDGYIYLRYYNVVNDKIVGRNESSRVFTSYNLTEYDDVFVERNNIYNNGGSEVYI